MDSRKKLYMDLAFEHAHEALARQEVPVGCIFVYNDKVIARGRNTVNETRNATRHAEMNCIEQVLEFCKTEQLNWKQVFAELSVFVTVEPCIMCAAALCDLNIKDVTFGCRNDRFGGETVFDVKSTLKSTIEMVGGYRADEAMDLLKRFYQDTNPNAPPDKVKAKKK